MCDKCGQDHPVDQPCPPLKEKPKEKPKGETKHKTPKQIRGDSREE